MWIENTTFGDSYLVLPLPEWHHRNIIRLLYIGLPLNAPSSGARQAAIQTLNLWILQPFLMHLEEACRRTGRSHSTSSKIHPCMHAGQGCPEFAVDDNKFLLWLSWNPTTLRGPVPQRRSTAVLRLLACSWPVLVPRKGPEQVPEPARQRGRSVALLIDAPPAKSEDFFSNTRSTAL
jgi:hypothetical protein